MALPRPKRTKVFISYSHQDVKWLERLKVHLRPLIRDQEVEVWDDTMIAPGSPWQKDIKRAIANAKAAILLISADFLASDFIAANELTLLLQAAERDGATIIPVVISPSRFQENQFISQFQAVNDPQKPLINLKKGEQEAVWVKVVEAIKSSLNISPESVEVQASGRAIVHQINNRPLRKYHQPNATAISYPPRSEQQDENDIKTKIKQNNESKNKSQFTKKHIKVSLTIIVSIAAILAIYLLRNAGGSGELMLEADEAAVYLDLTSSWVELSEARRKTERVSKATLYGSFILRKYDNDAQFSHRLGTSSVVPNPLDWRSDHRMEARPTTRKCASEVTTSYMLYFDIKDEQINVPFELKYEIDFWNAHNGEKGDWHQFYISSPTKVLTFRISFPKNKPYTHLYFLSGEGLDCSSPLSTFNDPVIQEEFDEKTGAKTVMWKIQSPRTHWVYRIKWDW